MSGEMQKLLNHAMMKMQNKFEQTCKATASSIESKTDSSSCSSHEFQSVTRFAQTCSSSSIFMLAAAVESWVYRKIAARSTEASHKHDGGGVTGEHPACTTREYEINQQK
jgi:hypothetical protein